MKWTTRLLASALLAFTLATGVSAQSPADVTCHAYTHPDGLVQLDCYGSVMSEVYERLVKPADVYDALAPIMQEWRTDLTWE